ncbi:STN domain-containing protein [Thermopirellula anaerolimosa]
MLIDDQSLGERSCAESRGFVGGPSRGGPGLLSAVLRGSALVIICTAWHLGSVVATETAPRADAAYTRNLERPCGIFWTDVPLRRGLVRLGEVQGVPIFLDRRVDPDQRVTLSLDAPSLRQALETLAAKLSLGVSYFQPIVYLGPPSAASRLRTLAALREDELPPGDRRRGLRKPPAWPALRTPREILRDLCGEAELSPENLEEIPHDLWPEVRFPAMPWTDRMTLVLIGFDRTFHVDPVRNTVIFTPITEEPTLTRRLPLPAGLSSGDILAQRWQQILPDIRVEPAANEVIAQGPLESLERLAEMLRGGRTATNPTSSPDPGAINSSGGSTASTVGATDPFASRRFTVRQGQGTLGGVINQLAAQLQMDARIDADALASRGIRLDRKITFAVNNGTVDDLWRAVLEPHGLAFERRGKEIRVFPAGP